MNQSWAILGVSLKIYVTTFSSGPGRNGKTSNGNGQNDTSKQQHNNVCSGTYYSKRLRRKQCAVLMATSVSEN